MKRMQTRKQPANFERILDENNAPVARMRLFSKGVSFNNRIVQYETVAGDKGCLACGNCIDACPVVKEKKRFVFIQNQRTSMSLENIVSTECRRCFACVRACPQVSKPVKEKVRGFRRGERIVHNYIAGLIFMLAATGIFLYHYKEVIPSWHHSVFKWSHFSLGILLLLAPLLYYLIDPHHLARAVNHVYDFGKKDLQWLKEFGRFLRHPRSRPLPNWNEFNTYHKFWFAYLSVVIPLMALTGIVNLLEPVTPGPVAAAFSYIHTTVALMTDLLVITHLYFKLARSIFRDFFDTSRSMQSSGNLDYSTLYHQSDR